ncbi:unnamed protein product [Parnassius apollo]|uniref:(apollo) hypothetical protein n=1 Tax=Parnassius apollo TaxID=110799 RepID=A0A8S3XH57_PARAO|nr:unnamed protein product [Parnassius apollo]
MEEKEMAVDDGDLIIFYVRPPDAGVYQCQIGFAVSGLVILEVLDDEDPYTVVKPHSSRGPYSSPPKPITSELVVFSSWSVWSECSRCGVVGRRRRYGICYVGYGELNQNKNKDEASDSSSEDSVLLDDVGIKLFQAFPGGVPCGSQLLPKTIKKLPALGSRRNEIMIALCKIPCKSQVFELRSNKGEIIERTNNSEGVYSLRQKEPPQPPTVVQDIIFAAKGSRVIVKCPG